MDFFDGFFRSNHNGIQCFIQILRAKSPDNKTRKNLIPYHVINASDNRKSCEEPSFSSIWPWRVRESLTKLMLIQSFFNSASVYTIQQCLLECTGTQISEKPSIFKKKGRFRFKKILESENFFSEKREGSVLLVPKNEVSRRFQE